MLAQSQHVSSDDDLLEDALRVFKELLLIVSVGGHPIHGLTCNGAARSGVLEVARDIPI